MQNPSRQIQAQLAFSTIHQDLGPAGGTRGQPRKRACPESALCRNLVLLVIVATLIINHLFPLHQPLYIKVSKRIDYDDYSERIQQQCIHDRAGIGGSDDGSRSKTSSIDSSRTTMKQHRSTNSHTESSKHTLHTKSHTRQHRTVCMKVVIIGISN